MTTRYSMPIAGFLLLCLGLMYLANVPGLTRDATVATRLWGASAVFLGLVVVALAIRTTAPRWQMWTTAIVLLGVTLMQLPPMILWVAFHNQVVADGPVGPVGNVLGALPHFVVVVAALTGLRSALQRK